MTQTTKGNSSAKVVKSIVTKNIRVVATDVIIVAVTIVQVVTYVQSVKNGIAMSVWKHARIVEIVSATIAPIVALIVVIHHVIRASLHVLAAIRLAVANV